VFSSRGGILLLAVVGFDHRRQPSTLNELGDAHHLKDLV
jgi:hypothetical protein